MSAKRRPQCHAHLQRKEDAKYEARKAEKRREVLLAEKAASELALKQLNENIRHLQENSK